MRLLPTFLSEHHMLSFVSLHISLATTETTLKHHSIEMWYTAASSKVKSTWIGTRNFSRKHSFLTKIIWLNWMYPCMKNSVILLSKHMWELSMCDHDNDICVPSYFFCISKPFKHVYFNKKNGSQKKCYVVVAQWNGILKVIEFFPPSDFIFQI